MGIGDRDVGRGRGSSHDQERDEQQHEAAEQAQLEHMRLLAMRKRQVQRKAARAAQPNAQIPTIGGAALGSDIRARMEPQLGSDLSHVRVFTGGDSATAADKLGARAFTTGSDVHFGAGEFSPGTKEGDRLIAHELTHAVQAQKSGVQRKPTEDAHGDSDHEHDVSQPGEPAEQEADAVADAAADNLHGNGGKTAGNAGKQPAPAVGAKLSGRKIFRAGKDPLKSSTKNALGAGPTTNAMHVGNAQQARVTKPPQHHVFPQQYRAWFADRGVNVDDFCINIAQGDHELLHDVNAWNEQVMLLLKQAEKRKGKGKLTVDEMKVAIKPLLAAAKLPDQPKFVRYGSPVPEQEH